MFVLAVVFFSAQNKRWTLNVKYIVNAHKHDSVCNVRSIGYWRNYFVKREKKITRLVKKDSGNGDNMEQVLSGEQ